MDQQFNQTNQTGPLQPQTQSSQTQPSQNQPPLESSTPHQAQTSQQVQTPGELPQTPSSNTNSSQPTPPASPPPPPNDIKQHLLSKNLLHNKMVIFVIVALLCLGVGFILIRQYSIYKLKRDNPSFVDDNEKKPEKDVKKEEVIVTISSEPTPSEIPSPTPPPSPPSDWKVYDFTIPENIKSQFSDWKWKNFTLYFPNAWSITTENYETSPPSAMITFSHTDGSSFMILQGFGEGGRCYYQTDPDYESASIKFVSYDDIINNGVALRISKMKDPIENNTTHYLCQKSEDAAYYSNNVLGMDKINIKGTDSYAQLLEMMQYVVLK